MGSIRVLLLTDFSLISRRAAISWRGFFSNRFQDDVAGMDRGGGGKSSLP